jgi:transposase
MTTPDSTPAAAVLVAIDIAKVRNEVLIEAPGHKRRRRLLVLNTRAEHDRLIEVLQAYGRPVVCAFEATGNYHRPIAWRLAEAGFEVRLVSSLALARTREALHNSWDKNDPKDAQVILHMLRIQATQVYHDPLRAGINDVQELSKTHEAIAAAKTQIQHRILTHYLPLYFPEIDRFRGNSRSDWFFAFLDAFPTPASITALTKEEFVAAAWDVVGRKVSKTQILMDIYETARSSIGLPLPLDAPAIRMFRMVIAEARSLIRQRNEIEAQADELLRHSQDYQLLRQIPGIGPINALTILAEAGNTRSSRAAIQLPTASLMLDDGTVEHRVRLLRPTDEVRFGRGALAETHWQPTERKLFCDLWQTEVAAVPEFTTSIFHIVTGLLLPIWRRLPDHDCQVYRIQTDAGERIIGRHIAPTLVATMFRNLGLDDVPTLAPEDAWTGLAEGRIGLQLANGLILRRSRVMNDYRVELIGFTDAMVPRLKALGLISEIISWKLRLFIPMAAQGSTILASLLDRHTLVGVTDRTAAA